METIHFLYPDENGCIYCKRINGLIKILPMKTPCLTCGKLAGTIQGAGCECVWNDFDFENGGTVAVFDPLAEYDRIDNDKAAQTVRTAVTLGYRLIDTAQAYKNEQGVGEGIRSCSVSREELFVASKVAAELKTYEAAAASIEETLEKWGWTIWTR